jgi:hypothetical protein
MEERIERTFATPDKCRLVVENVKGKIVVEGWDRPETEVVALRHQEWAEVEIVQDGNKVIARTKGERGPGNWRNWFNGDRTPVVEYTVHVPHTCKLKLKNVNGPIHVKQIKGKVRVNSVDGPVVLEAVAGDAQAETVNGELKATQLEGEAQLKSVNGKLSVQGGSLHEFSAHTVNGKVEVAATLDAAGHYAFHTVNGSCELNIPSDFRAQVSAQGINLNVECAQPAQSVKRTFGSWTGTIGPDGADAPAAEITFQTVNGHLRINNDGQAAEPAAEVVAKAEAPAAPSEPPTPPEAEATPVEVKVAEAPVAAPQDKSQLEILQMVERGEITVQEAVELLGD